MITSTACKSAAAMLLVLCLSAPIRASAQSIEIEQAGTELVDDFYLLDAGIKFSFDEEVLEALDHGVQLQIDIHIRLERIRKWLWDPTVKEDIISFLLERHPLGNYYLITNLKTQSREQYLTLEEALSALGIISKYILISKDVLDTDSSYSGYIMASLDIETLPPPLRPVAFVSRQWQMESTWYEWLLK
jgi:hypothetical protein